MHWPGAGRGENKGVRAAFPSMLPTVDEGRKAIMQPDTDIWWWGGGK